MKKRKALKSAVLVGLSAVLVGGVAMAAAGCGGKNKANEITVSMFSSNADRATNQKIADDWAAEYNGANNTEYTVKIVNNESKDEYFKKLASQFDDDSIGDVMYLAPRYVKLYARSGRVIDLTQFLAGNTELEANLDDVWPNALNYYGYDVSKAPFASSGGAAAYTMGQSIKYNKDGANGAGFYTEADGSKVGIYGLPKDYSNFSLGYNRVYFSEEMKKAYATTPVTQERSVWAGRGNDQSNSTGKTDGSANLKYDADTGSTSGLPVIRYAIGGSYDNPYDDSDQPVQIQKDAAANIINPGVPVKILPFNFYMWKTYDEALGAGDPIASLVEWATDGDGYTVTIPGFPDDIFPMPEGAPKDPTAPYDNTIGHMTYTYAEYGALLWSLTYYLNTFAWDDEQNPLGTSTSNPGLGGVKDSEGDYRTVYGGEQYEGGEQDGFQLYVLPWLYSNDADLINIANTLCTSYNDTYNNEQLLASQNIDSGAETNWANIAGNASEKVKKLRLDGTISEVDVQYGLNSQRFIETFAAFLAIGSDWNGNPNDSNTTDPEGSGWLYLREGRSIFYGAGTWDSATRNEEDKANVDVGQMPTPVAEKYALYSYIKDANYNMVEYTNGASMDNKTGTAGKITTSPTLPTAVFSREDILKNQVCRQDKWGARMDSVGYAVTCKSLSTGKPGGAVTEKTKAAASLCAALTIDAAPQIALTYGGAQLPNFRSQCEELLHYQDEGFYEAKKAEDSEYKGFEDIITFDGSATVKNTETSTAGTDLWNEYYKLAQKMGDEAFKRNSGGPTVAEFLAGETINGQPVKYNDDFKDVHLNNIDFASADKSAKSRYSFAMKVLNMVAFRKSDFDLLIRMQYGLNAVRDSSMYTYTDTWLNPHDARAKTDNNLCYYRAHSIGDGGRTIEGWSKFLKRNTKDGFTTSQLLTPFVWCMTQASEAQSNLQKSISDETNALINAMK